MAQRWDEVSDDGEVNCVVFIIQTFAGSSRGYAGRSRSASDTVLMREPGSHHLPRVGQRRLCDDGEVKCNGKVNDDGEVNVFSLHPRDLTLPAALGALEVEVNPAYCPRLRGHLWPTAPGGCPSVDPFPAPDASSGPETVTSHNDVIKWKHFPRYWPFVRGIHRSPVNPPPPPPRTKASDAEIWCILWSAPEQMFE